MEECAICYDAPANCLVVPCGHQCACEPCLERLQAAGSARCPICRARISSVVKVIPSGIAEPSAAAAVPAGGGGLPAAGEPASPLATSVRVASGDQFDAPNVNVNILPVDPASEEETVPVVVRVSVPEPDADALTRTPCDVVCVLDISGSMGTEATYEVEDEVRSNGLSILNVAAHGVKVILACLKAEDRFGLVAFDQVAEERLPLTPVNRVGRDRAVEAADNLRERGQTNIWAGLARGMDILRLAPDAGRRNRVVLLLTDGRPTISPPGGHVAEFDKYCAEHNFQCQLSCFGFGYSLDSKLLFELAEAGGGTFAFIPTAPVLGTVFTHAIAAVLCTQTTNAKLVLTSKPGALSGDILGGCNAVKTAEGVDVELGPLLYGQTRDVVVPLDMSAVGRDQVYLEAALEVSGDRVTAQADTRAYDPENEVATLRAAVIDGCREVVTLADSGRLREATRMLADLGTRLAGSAEAGDERVVALRKDVTGRMTKALDGAARYRRWGNHYIRALTRAHALQQCTNKLDFGVQVYGGALFALMRQRGEALFLALPPPVPPLPTCPICGRECSQAEIVDHTDRCLGGGGYGGGGGGYGGGYGGGGSGGRRVPASPARAIPAPEPVNMDTYTTEGGGCFGGDSTVTVAEGSGVRVVRVADVCAGDQVVSADGTLARVVCVVQTVRKDPTPLVAIPGGPFLTSKHPVRVDGSWRFPEGLGPRVPAGEDGTVFNFVLEPRCSMLVNGYECVTLGHGLKGQVVEHEFYGTDVVLNELQKLAGWKRGLVSIGAIVRDGDGHATGFTDGLSSE